MNESSYERREQSPRDIVTAPPASELLSDPARASVTWPELTKKETFRSQLEFRRVLNDRLDQVLSKLPSPDISLQDAVAKLFISEEQVSDLYESLAGMLEDPDYQRIALYLPFEFLPSTAWTPSSPNLIKQRDRFIDAFFHAWNTLLGVHDVRANFVDGDVLEIESRTDDLPYTVKAAHLIPTLVEHGLLTVHEIFVLIDSSEDEVLLKSIAETLPVLFDLELLHETELEKIKQHTNLYVQSAWSAIEAPPKAPKRLQEVTRTNIEKQLDRRNASIDSQTHDGITKKREAWIKQDQKRKAMIRMGMEVAYALMNDRMSEANLDAFLEPEASTQIKITFIEGVRCAVQEQAKTNLEQARMLYEAQSERLLSLWPSDLPEMHEALSQLFYQLNQWNLVTDTQLEQLGLPKPHLAGPFSENLKQMEGELGDIQAIVASVEQDPVLSQFLLPVVLVFGSRVKGYGSKRADIDVAVFVKPGTDSTQAPNIRDRIRKLFGHELIGGEAVEFWLEQTPDGLKITDSEVYDPKIGESSWTHILFGAAWEGRKDVIDQLQKTLLPNYFLETDEQISDKNARNLYLEELERDLLQYRLMHKGYERFNRRTGGLNTPHATFVDGESLYWDSGYRQTATQLFARNVFLPKIPQE